MALRRFWGEMQEEGREEMVGKGRTTGGRRRQFQPAICLALCLLLVGVPGCGKEEQESGYQQITGEEAAAVMEQETDYIILDVRTWEEYREKHIPGAICVPNETIGEDAVSQLPDKEQLILVYCRSGNRSKQASEKLVRLGYSNVVEFGGIKDWTGETVTGDEPGNGSEETESASVAIIGGADGPTSIFIAGKIGDEETSESKPAAFSLEEVGTFITQGAGYTELLGGEDFVLAITNAYEDGAEKDLYWYEEKIRGGMVYTMPQEAKDAILEALGPDGYRDAVLEEKYRGPVSEAVSNNPGSDLVYGPVCIPEYDSIVCGFLAADGENLEDLWYGIWWEKDGHVERIPLFTP